MKNPAMQPAPEFMYCNIGKLSLMKSYVIYRYVMYEYCYFVGAPAGKVDSPVVKEELNISSCVSQVPTDETALERTYMIVHVHALEHLHC